MRTHLVRPGFIKQTQRNCDCDDVRKDEDKRQTGDAGELADLDKKPMGMLRDADSVPAESAEKPAPQPIVCDPGASAEKSAEEVSPGGRKSARRDETRKPAPKGPVQCEVKRQQQR